AMIGSSMGGLITFYTGFKHQDVFSKLGVFSPSFWITPTIFSLVRQVGRHYPMKIYLLAGEKEGKTMVEQTKQMYNVLLEAGFPSHELRLAIRPHGEHNEIFWRNEFEEAYHWLMYD
ncbi:MAG: alpha/beta hydrolase-fold protein, partial [Flammeovirgaceae bacterium]|nr:alpha/beta hydrolase-fold protein [Flammeovirgaceae bacterium]MDW8288372.1 alpha/beta hydrolase-fold protein [Flammeovirgaceae bacterium]